MEDIKVIQAAAEKLGVVPSKYYIDTCKRLLEWIEKRCPITWNSCMGKKFILPNYRQPSYFSQDLMNYLGLEFITAWCQGLYGYDLSKDEILNTKYIAFCKSIIYQKPTYWLEVELAKALLETSLPEDFELEDLHWRFPAMRIYLPKGLLAIRRNNVDCSLMYMDITRMDSLERITVPMNIAEELRDKGDIKIVFSPVMEIPDQTTMSVTGTLDLDTPHGGIGYATTTPITSTKIKRVFEPGFFHHIKSPTVSDQLDSDLTTKMLRLSLNILMLMGGYPVEYDPKIVIRPARQEGKRLMPALIKAEFIGQSLYRPRQKAPIVGGSQSEGETREITPHWVKGHWRRVAYGPKSGLRKLRWIGMYAQGDISKL